MANAFIRKLTAASRRNDALTADDQALLMTLYEDVRAIGPRRDIIREGDRPDYVLLMIEGWAHRYKVLPDGTRQIMALMVPGDFCDAHITIFDQMDHNIGTINESRVAFISREKMNLLAESPRISRALWWATLVDEAVLRSWIVNLGRRDAYDRAGHLICELHARLRNVGLVQGDRFELPITQEDLADALGLTSVHVNRTLKRLREEELVTFRSRQITIEDIGRLQKQVGFDPNYLHLTRDDAGVVAGSHAFAPQPAHVG